MTALLVGASAGVGRALSEALAARGDALALVASDAEDLDALAAHLRTVYNAEVHTISADAGDLAGCVAKIAEVAASLGVVDQLYFPIGASRRDDLANLGAREILTILNSNLAVVMAITAHFLPQLLQQPDARVVGFGSIAAVRGRKANVVYSAAKRGLESYFESLRHLTAGTDVRVQFFRLGYVDTQQSFGQRLLFPMVSPQQVANHVLASAHQDFGAQYYPWFWQLIALAVAWLPWPLYKRLNF